MYLHILNEEYEMFTNFKIPVKIHLLNLNIYTHCVRLVKSVFVLFLLLFTKKKIVIIGIHHETGKRVLSEHEQLKPV